eukprot:TRINITY_DN4347_c2_g1_i1.p1 TRINITY_DN4347_c2_g1~~TRINITY_DN4347_c2_g1_i1.p1  ORF type:complete len:604 (+),score=134.15 TRINITY_DN4347_c2_g1_i1:88-1899(+)
MLSQNDDGQGGAAVPVAGGPPSPSAPPTGTGTEHLTGRLSVEPGDALSVADGGSARVSMSSQRTGHGRNTPALSNRNSRRTTDWRRSRTGSVRMSVTHPIGIPRDADDDDDTILSYIKREYHILVGFATGTFFMVWAKDHDVLDDLATVPFVLVFTWIFLVILWHAFAVVRHADCLAVKLGEPYGTLILTISVISIEVIMMAALMITGDEKTLARDTMFSVVMIVLNGMLGFTLIVGGVRHKEGQEYNLKSSQSFLNVILPLAVLSLVVPRFTDGAPGGEVSTFHGIFLMMCSVLLYGCFLLVQTKYHPGYFMHDANRRETPPPEDVFEAPTAEAHALVDLDASQGRNSMYLAQDGNESPSQSPSPEPYNAVQEIMKLRTTQTKLSSQLNNLSRHICAASGQMGALSFYDGASNSQSGGLQPFRPEGDEDDDHDDDDEHEGLVIRSVKSHTIFLILSMVPISMCAEKLAIMVERIVNSLNAPHALAGFLVATLVLSPEGMGAVKAALANKIQRTVNIALGSALSTIGLTVPAVLIISFITGKDVELGLDSLGICELALTLAVTLTTFLGGRVGILQGAVHAILFLSYVVLLFERDSNNAPADH